MDDSTRGAASPQDYRASHVGRGADYDEALRSSPFDAYMARAERRLLLELLPRLYPRGVGRHLDFACGTGRVTEVVAPCAATSVGVDVSPTMVALAREKCPSTEFIVHDVTVARLDAEPFDLVTSFRFLGNAQPALRTSAVRALRDLVAVGGYLVVNDHRNPQSLHNLLLRLRGRDEGEDLSLPRLRSLLSANGFAVESTHGIGLWVVRHSLRTRRALGSSWARRLEHLSGLPGAARWCPDVVVVARRLS